MANTIQQINQIVIALEPTVPLAQALREVLRSPLNHKTINSLIERLNEIYACALNLREFNILHANICCQISHHLATYFTVLQCPMLDREEAEAIEFILNRSAEDIREYSKYYHQVA